MQPNLREIIRPDGRHIHLAQAFALNRLEDLLGDHDIEITPLAEGSFVMVHGHRDGAIPNVEATEMLHKYNGRGFVTGAVAIVHCSELGGSPC